MANEKSEAKLLQEKLCSQRKNGVLRMTEEQIKDCDAFCEKYKDFMNCSKIEREVADFTVSAAKKAGYKEFERNMRLEPGDKVYYNNRGKAVILAVIGREPVEKGVHIAAAHIDSPRLDMKQHPLFENEETAYFKTHYYGGIKKYQWGTIPLARYRPSPPPCSGSDEEKCRRDTQG